MVGALQRLRRSVNRNGTTLARIVASRALPVAEGRKIILHVGLHKTGTTSIQALLHANRKRLAKRVTVIRRNDPLVVALTQVTRNARDFPESKAAQRRLALAARNLARSCRHRPLTLISNEDLLGMIPGRGGVRGLYPKARTSLEIIVGELRAEGFAPHVVIGLRDHLPWIVSLQNHLRRADVPKRTPHRFRQHFELPQTFDAFIEELRAAIAPAPLSLLSFEAERASGRFGSGLLRLAGLSDAEMDELAWPAPRNVRNAETVRGYSGASGATILAPGEYRPRPTGPVSALAKGPPKKKRPD